MFAPEYVAAVEAELSRCLERTHQMVCNSVPRPEYRLDLRGKIAGLALLREHCMRLNNSMLLEHGIAFVHQVVAHEMAHLVAYRRFGSRIKPHGAEWQWLMRDVFEREPNVTHNFAARLAHRRVFWYHCKCDAPSEFSLTRHRRARAGTRYICRICKESLKFLGKHRSPTASATNTFVAVTHHGNKKAGKTTNLQQQQPVQLELFS